MTSTREAPQRSVTTSPKISSGVSAGSTGVTPRRRSLADISAPRARELLVRYATPRPARCSAASVRAAPGFSRSPCQTQPSRSKTKLRSPSSNRALIAGGLLEIGDGVAVDALGPLGDARPGEVPLDAAAPGLAHAPASVGIVEQPRERGRERIGSRGRHEQAGLAVDHDLEDAADGRGHHGRLARHRLGIDDAER